MRSKEQREARQNATGAQVAEHELSDFDESPALPARPPHGSQLDARTLLALQKTAGNVAVSRFIQGTRAREGAGRTNGAAVEQAKRPRSFFGKAFDFAKRLRERAVAGGKSSFSKALEFAKRARQKAVGGGRSFFGKAFGGVKTRAQKAFGAVKAAGQKVGGGAKAVGGKGVAVTQKAAEGPKGFLQMVLGWARKILGIGQKEAQQALAAQEEEGGSGAGKKPSAAGGPAATQARGAAGGAGGASASGPSARAREDGDRAGGPAGPSMDGDVPVGAGVEADGAGATERPRTPEEDPRFQAFKGQLRASAATTKAHAPADAKAAEAQGAAVGPANEVASQAKGAQVEEMAAQKPGTFDKKAFMDAVRKAIEAASPKNLKEATEFSKSGRAGEVKDKVAGMVTQNKEAAEQGIKEKTEAEPDASKGQPKDVTPMSDEKPGAKPGPVAAAAAMPPTATPDEVDLSKGPRDVERELAQNDVTEDQLRESNEPDMLAAVDAKKEAEKHSAEAPVAFRSEETDVLAGAKGAAEQKADAGLGGMHESRVGALMQIAGAKSKTKSADETKRAKVASEMEVIYGKTKADVTRILDGIEPKVTTTFDTGEKMARAAFESYVDVEVSAYKKRRYSGWRGKLRWFRDKFKGLPSDVNKIYEQGKSRYVTAMDGVISRVADIVEKDLGAARARIAQGQAETAKYVAGLPKDLKKLGREAAEEMGERFTQLEGDIDSKQEELVSTIAEKYVEARDAVDKRIEEMKEANKGLIDKAIGFVKGVIDTLSKLKDLLMNVLRKAISVIGDILRHPIRFIENFMSGVKDGLNLFREKIGDYLESALIGWLFGPSVLGGQKIEKPESLDAKGVASLVLQVLGLTKNAILETLEKRVGAPAVAKLKQGVEWVGLLATEGPGALWTWIQDKVGDLYETVVGGIKDFVTNRIIRAGITWLISLLNPAGALVKIVKAIVDVITFIFERAEQIADFINAVLDAVIDVARGNVGGVAKKIADGLGKGLSLAIGFLASLLGLSGIGEAVRGIVNKVRAPVKRAVTKLIDGAVRQAKRLFGRPAKWVKKQYERGKKKVKELSDRGKAMAQKGVAWVMGKLGFARFKGAGESHEVYAEAVGDTAEVKVASKTPKDPKKFLQDLWDARIAPLPEGQKKQDMIEAWNAAMGSAGEVPDAVARLARVPGMPKKGTPSKEIQSRLEDLALDLQRLMDAVARGKGEIATGRTPQDPIPIVWFKKPSDYKQEIFLPDYDDGKGKAFPMRHVQDLFVPPGKGRASVGTSREDEIDVGGAGGPEEVEERRDLEKMHHAEVKAERKRRWAEAKAQGKKRPAPKRDELHRPINYEGLTIRIGVDDKWMPDVLLAEEKVVQRPVGSDPRKDYDPQAMRQTKAAPMFKDILEAYGFEWDKPAQDPDHVHDLGFGGVDDLDAANLWPAPETVNQQQFTRVYTQTVVYLDEDGQVKRSTPAQLSGKFFKIVELQ